uniref:BPTI/Kunitz inhibitor domain-containing protein n=1 Tax=Ursus americanus TaxID=9643 RepID=A0A452S6B0_URSAM
FPEKPDYCFLDEDSGLCRGYMTRYFYNNQSKKCEGFKYGGCLGNQNNFESLEQCKKTCEDSVFEHLSSQQTNKQASKQQTEVLPRCI